MRTNPRANLFEYRELAGNVGHPGENQEGRSRSTTIPAQHDTVLFQNDGTLFSRLWVGFHHVQLITVITLHT
jgi:hypothetical protein